MSLHSASLPGLSLRVLSRSCRGISTISAKSPAIRANPPPVASAAAAALPSRAISPFRFFRSWEPSSPRARGQWPSLCGARTYRTYHHHYHYRGNWQDSGSHGSPRSSRILMARVGGGTAAAALGTAAFVELSQDENGESARNSSLSDTGEGRMLEASRREIDSAKKLNDSHRGLSRLKHRIILLLDHYIWEPLCTGIRFLHLAAIFIPVIVAVPAIWFGRRVPERDNERSGTLWWYGFLVSSMELAGPAFIKLGQWAASRSDIFPTEACEIMSKLHSHAPAHSLHATRRIVEAAFDGRAFDDIFEEFQEQPLGVGAIAQVYRAKLKPDLVAPGGLDDSDNGHEKHRRILPKNVRKNVETVLKSTPKRVPSSYVAVKVLHPGVERTVRRDLRIMWFFASLLNAVPTIQWLSLPDEVAQFGEMMRLQLDLRIEAANLTLFRRNFRDRTTASFPFPYVEFTTRSVLVEEFAQGIPLADFIENGGGVFQHDIAAEGLDSFLRMLLLDNFVHADLHPGNIMVRFYQAAQPDLPQLQLQRHQKRQEQLEQSDHGQQQQQQQGDSRGDSSIDVTEEVLARLRPFRHRANKVAWEAELQRIDKEGFRPQLVFLDTGLVTELNDTNRRNFLDLFKAVAEFDGYRAGQLMCERCRQPDAVLDKDVFSLKMQHLVLGVKSSTLALGNVRIGDVLQRVLGMVRTHHVRLEGDFVNVVISVLLLEGIGRSLNPDLDLLSSSLPILRELGAQSGAQMVKSGDFAMLFVWAGLETRRFLQFSIDDVERCVKYDLLSPNV